MEPCVLLGCNTSKSKSEKSCIFALTAWHGTTGHVTELQSWALGNHSGALGGHSGALEGHSGALEGHSGALEGHSMAL